MPASLSTPKHSTSKLITINKKKCINRQNGFGMAIPNELRIGLKFICRWKSPKEDEFEQLPQIACWKTKRTVLG